jgi:Skp family chaperone for outer membrane proteins
MKTIKQFAHASLIVGCVLSFLAVTAFSDNDNKKPKSNAPAAGTNSPATPKVSTPSSRRAARANADPEGPVSEPSVEPERPDLEGHKTKLLSEINNARSSAEQAHTSDDESLKERLSKLGKQSGDLTNDISRASSEAQLQALNSKVEAFKNDAESINRDAKNIASSGWGDLFSLANLLFAVLLLLATLSLAFAVVAFVKLQRRVSDMEMAHGNLRQSHDRLKTVVTETKTYAEGVGSHVTKVRDDLINDLDRLRHGYREAMRNARTATSAVAAPEMFARSAFVEPVDLVPTFPALVSDYLGKTPTDKKKELESDFRTNLLVPAAGGPFTLVEDDDGRNTGIVLPKPRFQKSVEFSSYYKGYYHCDSPSAGEVYIVEPAIVAKSGGGWQLYRMGTLEVR